MRFTQLFVPTLKEVPKEAEVASHQLLLRGGYIRKLSAGIYSFLPLGWRTVRRIEQIVREEMDRAGALEVLLPAVQPSELWKESGRWDFYGPELLRFKDRRGGDFCFGPTHEEVITDLVRGEVRSYRDLPLNLYQIQTKFRDEIRPRAGLMRGREFVMKDAYSFDVDTDAAQASYDAMFDAYSRIFARCGLEFRPVEADTGNIGGSASHEFQVLADSGEDSIVSCANCGYTANVEKAELNVDKLYGEAPGATESELTRVDTPNAKTIDEIATFLDVSKTRVVKTILMLADDQPVAVLMRGDLDVNEVKVKSALGVEVLHMAGDSTVEELTGAPVGFAGPIGLDGVRILADRSVKGLTNAVVGANEADKHFTGVSIARDVDVDKWSELRIADEGDPCGRCGEPFAFYRGIEVGHIFVLGTKYSEPMGATILDAEGEEHAMVMGCYGIGITRIMSAAIEQNHDDNGIIWPMPLAPYQVIILPMQMNNDEVVAEAERIYAALSERGVDVLIDDRDARAGVKFNDADLIGVPLRITIGSRGLKQGNVELKHRRESEFTLVSQETIIDEVVGRIDGEMEETSA